MKTMVKAFTVVFCSLIVVSGAFASTQIPAPPQDRPIALVGGTIHPVNGPAIPNGTIVFADGVIMAIGAQVDIPAGARRIDVTGQHVYPGLIDAYTRIGLTEIGAVRATNDVAEVGGVNPNVRAEVAVNPGSEIIPVTRSNGVVLALSAPRGGIIAGTSALLAMDGWTWEDMTLKAPVAMQMSWPRMSPVTAWWMKQSADEQRKARDQNLKKITAAFTEARVYKRAVDAAAKTGAVGPVPDSRWDAMLPVLNGDLPLMVSADGIRQIEAAVAFAEREKVKLIIYGGYDAPYCTDLLKKDNVPVIISSVYRNPRRRDDGYDDPFTVPERLREAGIPFCIAGGGGAANERNLPYHAARAAAYGLPPDEALKAITLYPARILGVVNRVGSLETGKDATIIVCSGDILEIASRVQLEFIQGRQVDLSDKQKILWMKYREKYQRMGIGD